jgi:hypothetical protein
MAQFYGTLSGQRDTLATKCGTKASGMRGTIAGWRIGAVVYANHAEARGTDIISVSIDGGSDGSREQIPIITVDEKDTLAEIAEKLRNAADHLAWHKYAGWPQS